VNYINIFKTKLAKEMAWKCIAMGLKKVTPNLASMMQENVANFLIIFEDKYSYIYDVLKGEWEFENI
jgi:hypothetical protein